MFSVETNSISFIGLAVDGEYSMINVPSELCNGVGDSGLRLSTATVLSLTLISFDGMIVFDAIPSVTVQSGVVEDAVPVMLGVVEVLTKLVVDFPVVDSVADGSVLLAPEVLDISIVVDPPGIVVVLGTCDAVGVIEAEVVISSKHAWILS